MEGGLRFRKGRSVAKKTLFHRLFGVGKIPAELKARLEKEGVLLADEGIPGAVTFRDYRMPGQRGLFRRNWYTAAIALTEVRLVGLRRSNYIINVPWTDERLKQMRFTLERDDKLLIAFDAG